MWFSALVGRKIAIFISFGLSLAYLASEFQLGNLIRWRLAFREIQIFCQTKTEFVKNWAIFGQFWRILGHFWPFFPVIFSSIFRGAFFAKNFSPSHLSFFAKNEKLCNTSDNWHTFLSRLIFELKQFSFHENRMFWIHTNIFHYKH